MHVDGRRGKDTVVGARRRPGAGPSVDEATPRRSSIRPVRNCLAGRRVAPLPLDSTGSLPAFSGPPPAPAGDPLAVPCVCWTRV